MLTSDKTIDGIPISLITSGSEKRVEIKCDSCGKPGIAVYHNYMIGQMKRGFTGETFCRSCSTKINGKNRIGKPSWNKGKRISPEERTGKPYLSNDGYRMVFNFVENAKSKWEHYRKEHIVLMEEFLGRKLANDEEIHHLNGDKLDNDLSNLLLCESREHKKLHFSLQEIAYELVKKGIIVFDFEKREYKLKGN